MRALPAALPLWLLAAGCVDQRVAPQSRAGAPGYAASSQPMPSDRSMHLLWVRVATPPTMNSAFSSGSQVGVAMGVGYGASWSEQAHKGMTTVEVLAYNRAGARNALAAVGDRIRVEVTDKKIANAAPGEQMVLKCQVQYGVTSATMQNEELTLDMRRARLYAEFDFCEAAIPQVDAEEEDYQRVLDGTFNELFSGAIELLDHAGQPALR